MSCHSTKGDSGANRSPSRIDHLVDMVAGSLQMKLDSIAPLKREKKKASNISLDIKILASPSPAPFLWTCVCGCGCGSVVCSSGEMRLLIINSSNCYIIPVSSLLGCQVVPSWMVTTSVPYLLYLRNSRVFLVLRFFLCLSSSVFFPKWTLSHAHVFSLCVQNLQLHWLSWDPATLPPDKPSLPSSSATLKSSV